ncbi:MAG: hypothetical protein AAF561_08130 [Planctomycetota bacterium]
MPSTRSAHAIVIAASFLATSSAGAAVFDDGGTTIINSTVNDFIEVSDGPGGLPTTVIFEPGANITQADSVGDSVFATGNSSVIVNGGQFVEDVTGLDDSSITVNGGTLGDDLLGFTNATLVMTGGSVADDAEIYDTGSFVVSGGVVGEDLEAFDDSSLTFSGGTVNNNLTAEQNATIVMTGGSVGNDLESVDDASVTVRGGSIAADIEAANAGTIDIFGGELGTSTGFAPLLASGGDSVITLYGPEFQINGSPVAFGNIGNVFGTLSGTLSDGSTFQRGFFRVNEGSSSAPNRGEIVLVQQAIPEPVASLGGLIGLGLLVARRQRCH